MKHLYSLSILIACCSIARAQVNKGDIVLGGNIGYAEQVSTTASNTTPPPSNTYHNVFINPSVGKAIRNNLVLAIDLGYQRSTSSTNSGGYPAETDESNSFQAGVSLRRYKPLGNGFYLFGQAGISFGYSHSHEESPVSNGYQTSGKVDGYGGSLHLYPGIAYALNRHWQIETGLPNFFSLNYNHSKSVSVYTGQPEQDGTSHSFYVSSSLTGNNQFTVGVRYFIGSF